MSEVVRAGIEKANEDLKRVNEQKMMQQVKRECFSFFEWNIWVASYLLLLMYSIQLFKWMFQKLKIRTRTFKLNNKITKSRYFANYDFLF